MAVFVDLFDDGYFRDAMVRCFVEGDSERRKRLFLLKLRLRSSRGRRFVGWLLLKGGRVEVGGAGGNGS